MALRQYIFADESGTHETSSVCLVAGYRGSPGQWKELNKEWRAILALPDYRRVKVFHARIFFNRKRIQDPKKNPYLGWSDEKAYRFLGRLLKAITKRTLYPIGAAVDMSAWRALSHSERCLLAGYITRPGRRKHLANPAPYHLAFRVALEDGAYNTHPDTELHYTFAEQDQYQTRAIECWGLAKKYGQQPYVQQLDRLAFESPEKHCQLQVADLYARSWYNYFVRGFRLNRENWTALSMLNRRRADMLYCDAAGMEEMFHTGGVTDEARAQMRSHDRLMEEGRKVLAKFGMRL